MCSTNAINGLDACMNPLYLQGFLRDRFNFTGAVVTDGNSCGNANCLKAVLYIQSPFFVLFSLVLIMSRLKLFEAKLNGTTINNVFSRLHAPLLSILFL